MKDELSEMRLSVPAAFRFPEERHAVTPMECAERWHVTREQVFNILEREHSSVMNVTASKAQARTHIRIPIEEYYRITAKRVNIFERDHEWTFFGAPSEV